VKAEDRIDPARMHRALTGTRFAGGVRHFESIGSTNSALLEAAAEGAREGTVFLADEQTAGRGRGAHAWHSAPGDGLYLSALVRPALRLRDALLLSLATGLAVQQAVEDVCGVGLDIRWPNDLLVGPRKVGGVLVETAVEPGENPMLRYAVIGIGLNVHHAQMPAELRDIATSLALATPSSVPTRETIAVAILRELDLELNRLEGHEGKLLERFTAASTWVRGKRVHVPEQGGYTGWTSGLDERGFLRVTTDAGDERTVLSGGVREDAQR
jgi:BirA family biotin operon repressor/biotin-[acetyl-CoA-carboxylase] ligase